MSQYQMPRPLPPIGGASVVVAQTFVFGQQQPDRPRATAAALARAAQVEPSKRTEGPPVHQSFIFAISQPQMRFRRQAPAPKPPIVIDTPVDAIFRLESWSFPRDRRAQVIDNRPPIVQAAVAVTQTDVFQLGQPDLARWEARARRDVNSLQGGLGAPPQTIGPDTDRASFIFPVNQPEGIRWARRELARSQGGPVVQTIGAAADQTYEFVPNQPSQTAWKLRDLARILGGATLPSFGPTTQQTFIFPPEQPERVRYSLLQIARRFGGTVQYPLDTFATVITARVSSALVTTTDGGDDRRVTGGGDDLRTTE